MALNGSLDGETRESLSQGSKRVLGVTLAFIGIAKSHDAEPSLAVQRSSISKGMVDIPGTDDTAPSKLTHESTITRPSA